MANAKRCDRCGNYYDKNICVPTKGAIHGGILTGVKTAADDCYIDEHFDLCDDCLQKFVDFMESNWKAAR